MRPVAVKFEFSLRTQSPQPGEELFAKPVPQIVRVAQPAGSPGGLFPATSNVWRTLRSLPPVGLRK